MSEAQVKLHKFIMDTLADEDYYGGPMFRAYPTACRAAIADAIMVEVSDILAEEAERMKKR